MRRAEKRRLEKRRGEITKDCKEAEAESKSGAMPSKAKSSLADQFTGHFDRDWGTKKSRIREVRTERFDYSPNYSWDALSDNPETFSKLAERAIPVQTGRPCTLVGKRVIELEEVGGMQMLNVIEPPRAKNPLPLSSLQKDSGMSGHDINGEIPFHAQAVKEGKMVLMEKNYGFNNYSVCPPKFSTQEKPDFYNQAGEHGDQKLLNPTQRRKMMEFDCQTHDAKKQLQAAASEREKLRASIAGPNYHRGVLMCDSNDNVNSEIYADRARKLQEASNRRSAAHANRTNNLLEKGGTLGRSGGDWGNLLPDDGKNGGMGFQSKGRVSGSLSFDQTKTRLFSGHEGRPRNDNRAQHLRDMDLLGKNYNIVSGTVIEHGQSRIPERVDKAMAHPSQASLNGRNMQGCLRHN